MVKGILLRQFKIPRGFPNSKLRKEQRQKEKLYQVFRCAASLLLGTQRGPRTHNAGEMKKSWNSVEHFNTDNSRLINTEAR